MTANNVNTTAKNNGRAHRGTYSHDGTWDKPEGREGHERRQGRGKRPHKGQRKPLPESVIIDRKGRKVGSDDMGSAALVAKWGEQAGLRGPLIAVANSVSQACEAAVSLALDGKHRDAGKKAASVQYVLKRNERVGGLKVTCRDGRQRRLADVVSWFAKVHFKIADDIESAQAKEAAAQAEREAAEAARKEREAATVDTAEQLAEALGLNEAAA
jgi:hypothetical protein